MLESAPFPKVSVQVLAYNQERFIGQCLEGIVTQKTNFPFEAIVHDDASTDNTAGIIREYAERYPHIIKPIYETQNIYQKDPGEIDLIMQRNCKGEYIGFCEGDDYWSDPKKLQLQVDFMDAHSDYSMCFHRASTIYDDANLITSFDGTTVENRDYDINEIYRKWNVSLASVIYRKSMLERFAPIDKRIIYSDKILLLRCASVGKARGFAREMSVYRVHGGGVTHLESMNKSRKMRKPYFYEYMLREFSFGKETKAEIKRNLGLAYLNRMKIEKVFSMSWIKDGFYGFCLYPSFVFSYFLKKRSK